MQVVLKEKVDKEMCETLKTRLTVTSFLECKKLCGKGDNIDDLKGEYNRTITLLDEYIKNNFNLTRYYNYGKGKNDGRLFVQGGGLQSIQKSFRGLLADGVYHDFDMINCHPNILKYLCKVEGINTYFLDQYCLNRDNVINKICNTYDVDRKTCKDFFLSIINKHNVPTHIVKKRIKDNFLQDFCQELMEIRDTIFKKRKDLVTKAMNTCKSNSRDTWNIKGMVLNLYLCEIENKILMKVKEHRDVHVLCFDGYLEPISNQSIDSIILELNNITKEYDIKWSHKPHDTTLKDYIMGLDDNLKISFIGDDVNDVAEYLIKNYFKNNLVRSEGVYYAYDTLHNIWLTKEKEIKSYLYSIFIDMDLYIGEVKVRSKRQTVIDLVNTCLDLCQVVNEFLENNFRTFDYKICFDNGYVDFKTGDFKDYGETLKPFVKVNRIFNKEKNNTIREKIYEKVFNPIFGTVKEISREALLKYFLYKLSVTIAGERTCKDWFLIRGLRDCGKGVIGEFLNSTFGDYIGVTNAGNFITKDLRVGDEAKNLSWLMRCRFKRLLICDEISFKSKEFIDGSLIKKFRSGGQKIELRVNREDEVSLSFNTGLMFCVNEFPEIQPRDALERCDDIYLTSKFIDNDSKKVEGYECFKKDESIKDFIRQPDVMNEFIHILLEAYRGKLSKPEMLIEEEAEDEQAEDDIAKIQRLFTFNENEYCLSNDLNALIDRENILSKKDFKNKIKRVFPGVKFNHPKKIDGRVIKVVKGLEIIDTEI